MSQFAPEDHQGAIDLVSDGNITLESDRNQDGSGDLVFRTGGVERSRIKANGSGTGWGNVLGGILPFVTSGVTRDSVSRVTGYTLGGVTFTVGYDASTGLAKTISDGTTTRTISRDSSGLVTGVS